MGVVNGVSRRTMLLTGVRVATAIASVSLSASGLAQGSPNNYPFAESGTTAGTLSSTARCYFFQTEPGTHWDVTLQSSKFDAFLTIGIGNNCDSFRAFLRNDDSDKTYNSRIKFTADGGTYIIRVGARSDGRGDFNLNIEESEPGATKLPAGIKVEGAPVAGPPVDPTLSASTAPASGRPFPAAGSQIQDCPECPALVVVPAGSFMMGSSAGEEGRDASEGPRHAVKFDRPFAIGKYEVTFDEWEACVQQKGCTHNPNDQGWGRGRRPVIDVSWNDAMQYIRWLSRKTGQAYFLPSESEWEYATRAGTTTPWNTGNAIITDDANILNGLARTVPVGGYPANAFGLHDTHGNVEEWVADCYEVGYFGTPVNGGTMFAKGCKERVARGSIFSAGVEQARSARRSRSLTNKRYSAVGFRVARGL